MVILDSKRKETGTKSVAIATLKYVPCGVFFSGYNTSAKFELHYVIYLITPYLFLYNTLHNSSLTPASLLLRS